MSDRPRLLYLITEDWYFWSHRLDLARAAAKAGFDVAIATRVTDHADRIVREGFRLLPIGLDRRSRNPLVELVFIFQLIRLYRREKPVILHHVALKPILYGSVAAWFSGVPAVINAFAGLGYLFTDNARGGRWARYGLRQVMKVVFRLNRSVAIFQNHDDRDVLIREQVVVREQTRIIPGSGVDTSTFDIRPPAAGVPVVMLASRMLWDKGVGEFVEAARFLKRDDGDWRFVLVGRCDEHNPAAITPEQLQQWIDERVVEWWGHQEDMSATLAQATIVVLPSYREGLPKVLLEAAASGKAIVATDVPGCRDIVRHGVTGLLVPPRDAATLAAAIDSLMRDASLRAAMGVAGREAIIREYSVDKVTGQVTQLYRALLAERTTGKHAPIETL